VIHDLDTGVQKKIEVKEPLKCASSQHYVAVTTSHHGLHLYSTDSVLVHIVPDSTRASCVAFHSSHPCILAIGDQDGSVRMWNQSMRAYFSSFELHRGQISNVRFSLDGRLFLSSHDHAASIVTLDAQFQYLSSVKLKGHTDRVFDILHLLSSNQCVTCSSDKTIKVWNCETGVCLRTLTGHTDVVTSLALYLDGQHFASGSLDRTVIIWSSETFDVLHRIQFPNFVQSLLFGESEALFVGAYGNGVMSCNALTGEVGPVLIPGTGSCRSLSLSKMP
jgi:WD40 repeat protein